MLVNRLTYQEISKKLRDARDHHKKLATEFRGTQKQRLERISIVARSLRDNLQIRDGNFGLDLEAAVENAQRTIPSEQGTTRGTSIYEIHSYIRIIEGYTQIKYLPTSQSAKYPQCPLLN